LYKKIVNNIEKRKDFTIQTQAYTIVGIEKEKNTI